MPQALRKLPPPHEFYDLTTLEPWERAAILLPDKLPAAPTEPCHCGETLFWLKARAGEDGADVYKWVCHACNLKPLGIRFRVTIVRETERLSAQDGAGATLGRRDDV